MGNRDLSNSSTAHNNYGAPENVTIDVNITGNQLEFAVLALGKTASRLPEAAFVTFAPGAGSWSHEVLGGVVPASTISHGSTHLHGAEAVRWTGSAGSLRVASLDAGLLC